MTEEDVRQLIEEHAELKAARKDQRIEGLGSRLMGALLRIEERERRLTKESQNSSKPPSSDGLKRKGKPRQKSSQPEGGQAGHQGHPLQHVATPDRVLTHRPGHCAACQCEFQQEARQVKERRHIHEAPEMRLLVTEHRVEALCCPACQHLTVARFPAEGDAPAHYGPQMQALAVSSSQFQLLPMERIGKRFADLWGCHLSESTLAIWIAKAARTLEPRMLLLARKVDHVDETGGRIKGLLQWFHVNATPWLTLHGWHRKRGQKAMDSIGIVPHSEGRAIHDRLSSDDYYPYTQSVCGAHLFRDCVFVAEHDQQSWAQAMDELLLRMRQATKQWRASGTKAVPKAERDTLLLQYCEVLQQGFAAHCQLSPPETAPPPLSAAGTRSKKRGRPQKDDAKHLLDALLKRAEQVRASLDDLSVPLTRTLAERDLRMIKVQQKISGTFRRSQGATALRVMRSSLSQAQARSLHAGRHAVVFEGSPFPIAWEPGT